MCLLVVLKQIGMICLGGHVRPDWPSVVALPSPELGQHLPNTPLLQGLFGITFSVNFPT